MIAPPEPLSLPDLLARLSGVRQVGRQHQARCPVHEDGRASLTIGTGDDGRILLHCHAGCGTEDVARALGVEMRQLFRDTRSASGSGREIVAVYEYVDEDSTLLYEAVRYEPKDFRQRRPGPGGEYVWSVKGVRHVLYRLPEVIEAVALDRPVYIVEGEKDVDRLRAAGLAATCNVGGACKWRDDYSATLQGARVIIFPDNDEAGRKHASQVALSLEGVAASVKTVPLPGVPEQGDVSDYLNAGHTVEELLAICESSDSKNTVAEPERRPFLTAREIEQRPKPVFLVHEVIEVGGLAVMWAPPGAGKSFVAIGMACDVAAGIPFLGRPVVRGPAVYVIGEGVGGIGSRVRAWRQSRGFSADRDLDVHFKESAVNLTNDAEVARFIVDVASLPARPALIVFDTLAQCSVGGDENSQRDMGMAMAAAQRIARETGAAVLLLHHTVKDGSSIRGSSALPGAVDTNLALKKDGTSLTITCEKQRNGVEGTLLAELGTFGESCAVTPKTGTGVTPATLGRNHHKMLHVLTQFRHENGASATTWKDASGIAASSFYAARSQLLDWGYVALDKKLYTLTPAGEMVVTPNSNATPNSLQWSGAASTPSTPPFLGGWSKAGKLIA